MPSQEIQPLNQLFLWFFFGVPIVIFVVGIIVYSFKPKRGETNGATLIVLGIIELFVYVTMTHGFFDLVIAIMYLIIVLTIFLGTISLIKANKTNMSSEIVDAYLHS